MGVGQAGCARRWEISTNVSLPMSRTSHCSTCPQLELTAVQGQLAEAQAERDSLRQRLAKVRLLLPGSAGLAG